MWPHGNRIRNFPATQQRIGSEFEFNVSAINFSFLNIMVLGTVTMETYKQNENPFARGLIQIKANKVKSQSK